LIPEGAHQPWLDLLHNHGFYATCQPQGESLEQQEMSSDEARECELKFFDKIHPWSSVSERHLLGTEKLVQALSAQFCNMIGTRFSCLDILLRSSLPSLIDTIRKRRKVVKTEVSNFPAPFTGDSQHNILGHCRKFTDEVTKYTEGQYEHPQLIVDVKENLASLSQRLWETMPTFDHLWESSATEIGDNGQPNPVGILLIDRVDTARLHS